MTVNSQDGTRIAEALEDIAAQLRDIRLLRLPPFPRVVRGVAGIGPVSSLIAGVSRSYVEGMPCWCEHGIGNPMVKDHSPACARLRQWWSDHG